MSKKVVIEAEWVFLEHANGYILRIKEFDAAIVQRWPDTKKSDWMGKIHGVFTVGFGCSEFTKGGFPTSDEAKLWCQHQLGARPKREEK